VGAYASSTTYVSGNAVLKAARQMKMMLVEEAARALKVDQDKIEFDGNVFHSKNSNITLSNLANRLYYNEDQKQLTATSSYVGHKSPPPFMAGFVEIDVDTETGEIDIIDYVSIVDCGTPLNLMLAKGQIEGAIVQGLGMARYEDVKYSKAGKLLNNSFLYYKIPTSMDIAKLTTEFAESFEQSGPFGAKSVGEIGIDTPPAALSNAVYNAVGVRITELPITPEKILKAIKIKKEKGEDDNEN
jgi:putative selenate reductase molybdopterin-binding subunit